MVELEENVEIWFHKPGKQIWINLIEDLEGLVKYREQGEMELLPDDFCAQLMDSLIGMQDPSPPKPAPKKFKQRELGDTEETSPEALPQEGWKDKPMDTIGWAGREQQQREEGTLPGNTSAPFNERN